MTMNIYIRSAACISPTTTIGSSGVPPVAKPAGDAPAPKPAGNRLTCIEPDYKGLIEPKTLRRMSRIIRMGVATAMACLREADTTMPDAIVTGTGYGCLEDTDLFLTSMIQRKEEALQPATFIQSTHNTVGAQIALILQCTGYNNTFVHRGFSFENAILDAILLLQEGEAHRVLAGGIDELTDPAYEILTRFGLYRHTLAGEGAAFFLLTNEGDGEDLAKLEGIALFDSPADIGQEMRRFLEEHTVDPGAIDLVMGDEILPGIPTQPYKTQCGEYPTSTAYAFWLATQLIKTGTHRRILIHNQYLGIYHAAFLLAAAK
jgi:3-oxoacyl-[acyl-carrier-protein] synthase II